ncbi:MAG: ribonuclease J [Firmicutes bacterium]|nr:ribonuclease J [Bacillota bacterium]
MLVFHYGDDIFVVDAGLAFPDDEMLGIDLVIPDLTYLLENKEHLRGIVLTHGHEDHIGALPYVLKSLPAPVFGTKLTLGLVEGKLAEHGLTLPPGSRVLEAGESLELGVFGIELFRVNHSIPDSVGLAIRTPVGMVVHTGDFKFDQTPVDREVVDFHKLAELGQKGVLVLLSDSTNAERPGFTPSERVVGETLGEIFRLAKQRVLVASFATNVHRIQQVITAAYEHDRQVAVVGRSMENVVEVALKLGYLSVPDGLLVEQEYLNRLPLNRVAILATGSQGEPMSALTRISLADHRKVEIVPGDTVIIAATPVPGNEKMVHRTVDNLYRRGANVFYEAGSGVHVSGHASQEELKLMLNFIRPRYFVPVHGEYRHLIHHSQLAQFMGLPRENILVGENGTVFEFTEEKGSLGGRVPAGNVLVDGLGVGDVGSVVLRDRKQLSQDGILVVVVALDKQDGKIAAGPDIISRGFVYVKESEALMEEARGKVREALEEKLESNISDWSTIKASVRDSLGKFLNERTRRRPMILPVIMEI